MFRIDSNKVIKMSRGDYVEFPLFINRGTIQNPIKFIFKPESYIIDSALTVYIDSSKFKECMTKSDYSFIYLDGNWTCDGDVVNLSDYGISIADEQLVTQGSSIHIEYFLADSNIVYFDIYQVNSDIPVLHKELRSDGTVYIKRSVIKDKQMVVEEEYIENEENINSFGDIVIRLYNEDTKYLPENEYRYQISADLVSTSSIQVINNNDEINPRLIHNTLTNKLPIFIFNDDIDRDWSR